VIAEKRNTCFKKSFHYSKKKKKRERERDKAKENGKWKRTGTLCFDKVPLAMLLVESFDK